MPIIAYWNGDRKESGQTLSMAAVVTYMAISHNKRILAISTEFMDTAFEDCFWDLDKENEVAKKIAESQGGLIRTEVGTGVEGVARLISSNKINSTNLSSYTKTVFKNRLDILMAPKTKRYEEYLDMAQRYIEILQIANKTYDLVFIDLSKKFPMNTARKILEIADIVNVDIKQGMKSIERFTKLKEADDLFKKNNILITLGKYNEKSKYTKRNISRTLRENEIISCIPDNVLFYEACEESKITEFFLRIKTLTFYDENKLFLDEVKETSDKIIEKVEEIQMTK